MPDKTILIVGTYDTKNDELAYMAERVTSQPEHFWRDHHRRGHPGRRSLRQDPGGTVIVHVRPRTSLLLIFFSHRAGFN